MQHPRSPLSYALLYPLYLLLFFFFNDTATTEIYTLSLHDALPISSTAKSSITSQTVGIEVMHGGGAAGTAAAQHAGRSEEHTSELQSRPHLVCRLLLEKKKKQKNRLNKQSSHKMLTRHHTQIQCRV